MDFEALISGEQAALTRRLARSLGGDVGTAEDLWQELTIRAWRRLPRDADHNAQRAWLRRTATNLTVDELRRRARRPTTALDDAAELAVDGTGEPDAARAALARLTAHERLLLLLRFDAGLQHGEIASVLDISEEAARKRVERARKLFVRAYRAERADGAPLILVTARDRRPHNYVRWLEQAGARVRVKEDAPSERELALADGIVFGGDFDDIHSDLYGEAPRALRGRTDLARDRADLAVVSSVLALDLPYVGICRGHQLLNIACGGNLYQDVVLDGVASGSHDIGLHRIETPSASAARTLLGKTAEVHSEHHQAVRRLGRRLRVAGLSPDGVIESVEHEGRRFALGLQWHPEETPDAAGGRIAEALVAAATNQEAA
jgi:putative glutamine amidotransferase